MSCHVNLIYNMVFSFMSSRSGEASGFLVLWSDDVKIRPYGSLASTYSSSLYCIAHSLIWIFSLCQFGYKWAATTVSVPRYCLAKLAALVKEPPYLYLDISAILYYDAKFSIIDWQFQFPLVDTILCSLGVYNRRTPLITHADYTLDTNAEKSNF